MELEERNSAKKKEDQLGCNYFRRHAAEGAAVAAGRHIYPSSPLLTESDIKSTATPLPPSMVMVMEAHNTRIDPIFVAKNTP